MNRLFFLLLAGLAGVAMAAPVRNPFWPIGYEGVREEISDGVRTKARPAPVKEEKAGASAKEASKPIVKKEAPKSVVPVLTAAEKARREAEAKKAAEIAEQKKREIGEAHWIAAKKTLQIGGHMIVGNHVSVTINGKVYADGDQISFTHDNRRFTWRISGLSDAGKLKLDQVQAHYLENGDGSSKDKGGSR